MRDRAALRRAVAALAVPGFVEVVRGDVVLPVALAEAGTEEAALSAAGLAAAFEMVPSLAFAVVGSARAAISAMAASVAPREKMARGRTDDAWACLLWGGSFTGTVLGAFMVMFIRMVILTGIFRGLS